jgi:hypothetical protein
MASLPIVELRQYTMVPGRLDEFLAIFESKLTGPQAEWGAPVLGIFRDRNRPDFFVWLRGFADMAARLRALEGFYGSPLWKEHRDAVNATLVDNDNVLLLRALGDGLSLQPSGGAAGLVVASLHALAEPADEATARRLAAESAAALGPALRGTFVTELAKNDFPRLPVRDKEYFFVWVAAFPDAAAYSDWQSTRGDRAPGAERLELVPTEHSPLR